MISNSFDICGITQNDQMVYHSALRHILTTDDLRVDVLDELDGTEDLNEMFIENEDDAFEVESMSSDDTDGSEVESMDSDATDLLSDELDGVESNVEATDNEMDSDDSVAPTTNKASVNKLKRSHEPDEEVPAPLNEISNRLGMTLRKRVKLSKVPSTSKNSMKRRHEGDENIDINKNKKK